MPTKPLQACARKMTPAPPSTPDPVCLTRVMWTMGRGSEKEEPSLAL